MLTRKTFTQLFLLIIMILLTSCTLTIDVPANNVSQEKTSNKKSNLSNTEEKKKEFEIAEKAFKEAFIGKEVPDLQMKNLNGEIINIKDIKGPFLLNFSRYDCPSCIEYYPVLSLLKNDGIQVVEVYYRNSRDELLSMFEDNNFDIDYNLISGIENAENNKVMDTFKLIAVPTTFFIDSNKIVRHIETNSLQFKEVQDIITEYLY